MDKLTEYYNTSKASLEKTKTHDREYFRDYINSISKYVPANARVLDLGCGVGLSSAMLQQLGYRVTGLDISSTRIKNAHARDMIDYVVGDAINLPFEDEYFEAIGSINVIEHIPQPMKALTEMNRCLKGRGFLVIYAPNFLCPLRPLVYRILRRELAYKKSCLELIKGNLKRMLRRAPIFEFKDIELGTVVGGDRDAAYLANILDLKYWLKDNGYKLLQYTGGFIERIPFFKDFSFGIRIVGQKMRV